MEVELKSGWENPDIDAEVWPEEFPIVEGDITYDEFFKEYLIKNRPCLIRGSLVKQWNSFNDWRSKDGKASLDFLAKLIPADEEVPVSNCGKQYFNAQEPCEQTFRDFCHYWKDKGSNLFYLKDWHFVKRFPSYTAYQTPPYFASDWLNEFWEHRNDGEDNDYKFVYIGPKGSWTPFHSDVFGSFSWSANVVGRKKWTFFPPGQERCLKDRNGKLVYNVDDEELKHPSRFPSYSQLRKRYDVIQETGEIIFVPSMWHHQVMNLEDTISINHNWFNASNIHVVWSQLSKALDEVKVEISDCKDSEDWDGMCQSLLKASHGMDYGEFISMLECIGKRRKQCLEADNPVIFDSWSLGPNHAMFDLYRLKCMVSKMFKNVDIQKSVIFNERLCVLMKSLPISSMSDNVDRTQIDTE